MGNQRKKARRRADLSRSNSGLDGVIDQRETMPLHQEVDMEWLDDQAEAGRFGEVADEEMLIQMPKHLPQYSP